MKQRLNDYKRIVIKIGSSFIYSQKNIIEHAEVEQIAMQIASLAKAGKEIIIVSSGAIAMGMGILKMEARPKELSSLQAAASVGQHELMEVYRRLFKQRQLNCAQILLTWEDFADRKRYLNTKNTLYTLLKLKVIPIINENDTVSTEEIKFGDNDRLSAMVSILVGADLLIMLSDVEGLLAQDKKTVIRVVNNITPQIKGLACPTNKKRCVGGMITKIEAAKIATESGIPCIVANGSKKDIVNLCINSGLDAGTLFLPAKNYLAERIRRIYRMRF